MVLLGCDTLPEERLAAVRQRLRGCNPDARLLRVDGGAGGWALLACLGAVWLHSLTQRWSYPCIL